MIPSARKYCIAAILFLETILTTSYAQQAQQPAKTQKNKTSFPAIFWTNDKSPSVIGKKMMEDLFTRPVLFNPLDFLTAVHYAEACTAFGATRLAVLLDDTSVLRRLSERYLKVLQDGPQNSANHVDANVYGILPLELYRHNGDKRFLKQGMSLADTQWKNPLPDGLSNQTRYWIDDMYMITSLQVEAFRVTANNIYLERAALEADAYIQKLQQPNGLFFHGEKDKAPFFWGRGNGWVAAGLAELLTALPHTDPHYKNIVAGFQKMMHTLLHYQTKEGLWRQLVDHEEAWIETSSSAMFGYAMTIGVKKGFLAKKDFEPAYKKAWLALAGYVNAEGKVANVCVGTGQSLDVNYYLSRPTTTGDFHGQAPVLWFAWSLLKKY